MPNLEWLNRLVEGSLRIFSTLFVKLLKLGGRLLVLPVDCLFFLFDLLVVNLRKANVLPGDCRCPFGCVAAEKYTNKFLFRLVCGDFRYDPGRDECECEAEDTAALHALRGVAGLLLLGTVIAAVLIGPALLWNNGGMASPFTDAETSEKKLEEVLSAARKAFSADQFDTAAKHYEQALRLEPGQSKLHYRLAQCWDKEGWDKLALNQYRLAASADDGSYALRGAEQAAVRIYRKGLLQPAWRLAERALELNSESAAIHAIAAEKHLMRGDRAKAQELLQTMNHQETTGEIVQIVRARLLLAEGKLDEASGIMDAIDPQAAGQLPTYGLCRARYLSARGRLGEASEVLDSVIGRFPEAASIRVAQIKILLAAGRREDAFTRLRQLEKQFELPDALTLHISRLLDRYGEQGRALQRVLTLTDSEQVGPEAHVLAGEIYLQRDLLVPAASHARRTLDSVPDHLGALVLAGRAALKQGHHLEAQQKLEKAVQVNPRSGYAHYLLGKSLLADEQSQPALKHLRKACELQPANGEFRYRYGMTLAKTGNEERALKELQKAPETMPDRHRVYTWMGILAARSSQPDKAALFYQKAIDAAPDRAAIASNNLADMLLSNGKHLPIALALAYQAHTTASTPLQGHSARSCARALMAMDYGARTAAALGADGRIRRAAQELIKSASAEKNAGSPSEE